MPITNDTDFIEQFVGANKNIGTFGPPEVPNTSWGNNGGGYINDWPTDKGGWTTQNSISRIFPWGVVMCTDTYNPEGKNWRVQLRFHRSYIRRRSDKVWIEQGYSAAAQAVNTPLYYRFPDDVNTPIPSANKASAPSGGTYHIMINEWCMHPFQQEFISPNYTTYDCWGGTLQARLVPKDNNSDFAWEEAFTKVGVNTGADNYKAAGQPQPWVGEHCHNRFTGLTNRWTVTAAATVKRPSDWPGVSPKPDQGAGITVTDYQSGDPLPQPPEEEVWVEKGAYNATTNKITMYAKRSAAVSSNKTYTLTRTRGNIADYPSSVTIPSGASFVAFEVTHPGTMLLAQQCVYISDGSTEDHWATFTLSTAAAPGPTPPPPPPGPAGTTRTNYMLNSEDLSVGNASNITVASATSPPSMLNSWQKITGGATHTGGIARFCNVPNGAFTGSLYLKADSVNFALIKVEPNTYNKAEWIWINLTNGAVTQSTTNMPNPTTVTTELVATGVYRVKFTTTLNDGVPYGLELSPCTGTDSWVSANGGSIFAGGLQFESGSLATLYKRTGSEIVTRTLTTMSIAATSTNMGVGTTQNIMATLLDDTGAAWDQYPVTFSSSNVGVCNFDDTSVDTDASGVATALLSGLNAGTAAVRSDAGTLAQKGVGIVVDSSLSPISVSATQQILEFTQSVTVQSVGTEPVPAIDASASQQMLDFTQSFTGAIISTSDLPASPTMIIGQSGVSPIGVVGTGIVGAEIDIYVDGVLVNDNVEVDQDGIWSTTLDLSEGTYQIYVVQIVNGETSGPSAAQTLTVLAVGVGGSRFRSGSGTGPRKAIRPTKPPKSSSWPTR